jgi:CheY-like chemotaxis protein
VTKILLVDDHADIRLLMRVTLGKAFEISEAKNGVEAVEQALLHRPDLMVLDVMMPGEMDGLTVLDAIRGHPSLHHTRVIMVTARGQVNDIEIGMQRGADAYITKPFSPLHLITCIKKTLASTR